MGTIDVAANIVLVGGVTQLRGFQHRLLRETEALLLQAYPSMQGQDLNVHVLHLTLQIQGSAPLDQIALQTATEKIKCVVTGSVALLRFNTLINTGWNLSTSFPLARLSMTLS
jgi:actin-related protein